MISTNVCTRFSRITTSPDLTFRENGFEDHCVCVGGGVGGGGGGWGGGGVGGGRCTDRLYIIIIIIIYSNKVPILGH